MRTSKYTWPASSTTVFGSGLTITSGTPLVLSGGIPSTNIFAGGNNTSILPPTNPVQLVNTAPTYSVNMAANNIRQVSLTSASNLSGINFTIVAMSYGVSYTEVLAGPNANTVVSVGIYQSILSITPSATSGSTVSVGYANYGYFTWFMADVWNADSLFTMSYGSSVTTGLSYTPVFTNDRIESFPNGVLTYLESSQTSLGWDIPLTSGNVTVSTINVGGPIAIPTTVPLTIPVALSVVNIPLTGLSTVINQSQSLTQIITQQGGKY